MYTVGEGTVTPSNGTYLYGTNVFITATAAPGWTFQGWSGDASGSTDTTITMNGNKVVTATFTQIEYTLDISVVGGGSVSKSPNQETYHYGDTVTLTATPNAGWTFTGWSGDLTGTTNPATLIIDADPQATATFTQIEYTLAVSVVGSGSVARSSLGPYHYGDVVELTANAAVGWSFSGWSGDASGSANPLSVTVDGNKAVTATFTQNEYTLSVNVVGSGSVTKIPDLATYHYGDSVQLTATANLGYTFVGWSGDLSGSASPATLIIDENPQVTANFVQNTYSLTMYTIGQGSVAPGNSTGYHYGDVAQLQAMPANGWSFAGWSGDVSGSTNTSLTIKDNAFVTATFTQNNYALSISVSPPAGGSVTKNPEQATYHYGDSVQLKAIANSGYTFVGWGGDLTGTTNPATLIIDENPQVTATFTQNTYALSITVVGGGSVTKSPDKSTYQYGDVVRLTATPATGWSFAGWSGDLSGTTNPQTITIDASKSVTATFIGPKTIKQRVLNELKALRATITDKGDGRKLDEVINHLTKSLDPDLLVDETHVDPKHGKKVFNEEKEAVVKLAELIKDKKCKIPDATLQGFINRLVSADRALASVAIKDAIGMGGDAKKIDKANKELGKGDAKAADNKFADAIEHYRKAWKHAQKALPHKV
jgi:uncharacterized repeat protein (TIGR02543 family)